MLFFFSLSPLYAFPALLYKRRRGKKRSNLYFTREFKFKYGAFVLVAYVFLFFPALCRLENYESEWERGGFLFLRDFSSGNSVMAAAELV